MKQKKERSCLISTALCGTGGSTAGDSSPAEAWVRYKSLWLCDSGVCCWIYCAHTTTYKNWARAEPSSTSLERNQQQKIIYTAGHASRTSVPLFSVILLESYSKDSTSLKLPQVPLHCHQRQKSLKALESRSRKGEKQAKFYQLGNPEHHGSCLASFCLFT